MKIERIEMKTQNDFKETIRKESEIYNASLIDSMFKYIQALRKEGLSRDKIEKMLKITVEMNVEAVFYSNDE